MHFVLHILSRSSLFPFCFYLQFFLIFSDFFEKLLKILKFPIDKLSA